MTDNKRFDPKDDVELEPNMIQRLIIIASVLITLVAANPANAKTTTGNQVVEFCGSNSEVQIGFCLGYIVGTWEGIKAGIAYIVYVDGKKSAAEVEKQSNELLGICIPTKATTKQMQDTFLKFLTDNPNKRHESARILMMIAYRKAFPCNS